MLISYSLIKIYIFGNDYFISLSLVLIFLFIFISLNGITQFTFVEAEIQKSNTTNEWLIEIFEHFVTCFPIKNTKRKYDLKIKNFILIQIKRGITYFWDPQHPARIHLYMLSSASISHQAFLLHLMQPCKEIYQTVRNKTSRSCCFQLA